MNPGRSLFTSLFAARHIQAMLGTQFLHGLCMGSDELRRFAQSEAVGRLKHLQITGLLGLFVFDLSLIIDRQMLPDVFEQAAFLRLFVLTPLLMLFLGIGWLALRRGSGLQPWIPELVAMSATIATTVSLGVMIMDSRSEYTAVYKSCLLPVLVYANLVQRLRFRQALLSTCATLIVYATVFLASPSRPQELQGSIELPMTLSLVLVALYTLSFNYSFEMDDRRRFLQNEREKSINEDLKRTHDELRSLSSLDPLTGLANRRSLGEYLQTLHGDSKVQCEIGLILLDVDHFKAYNDTYGHPAGDECLRMLSGELKKAVGQHSCKVFRWGGEEFAVVMKASSEREVMLLAEDIRGRIERLRIRHRSAGTAECVTISCGIAHGASPPGEDSSSWKNLLEAADRSLYAAKSQGRNRCCQDEVAYPQGLS